MENPFGQCPMTDAYLQPCLCCLLKRSEFSFCMFCLTLKLKFVHIKKEKLFNNSKHF